jgi:hypothetical protein
MNIVVGVGGVNLMVCPPPLLPWNFGNNQNLKKKGVRQLLLLKFNDILNILLSWIF